MNETTTNTGVTAGLVGTGVNNGDGFIEITEIAPICYLKGTRILTGTGETPVEALKAGDVIVTASGALRPVRWIGYRTFDLRRHATPDRAQPVRIRTNAFSEGVPHRDLLVSPAHAVLLHGVLVPARLLINGASIVRETDLGVITYYHIELDTHDILVAENLPAESYLDTGNRSLFENAGVPIGLHPDFSEGQARREAESCAPFADKPEQVEPVWRALAVRAEQLGWQLPRQPKTTSDPALSLFVDGRRIAPVSVKEGRHLFILPRAVSEVWLTSRSAVPSEAMPWVSDDRRLGVSLKRLTLRSGTSVVPIALDDPALGDGWWDAEWHSPTVLRRWTNGDAVVPLSVSDLLTTGPCQLEVEIADALSYRVPAGDVANGEPEFHHTRRAAA